jgi:hypothetical protein
MIRNLTILTCCFAAAIAVSFAAPSDADAQVFSQRSYRPGHFVGNTTRAFTNSARQAAGVTRNVFQRSSNWSWNGNRNYGYNNYNNGYSYQNTYQNQYQNQFQNEFQNQNSNVNQNPNQFQNQSQIQNNPTPVTQAKPMVQGQAQMTKSNNTTGTASVTPARTYTPIPTASEQIRRYVP